MRSKYNRPDSLTLVLKWMSLVYNTLHCCWILMFGIAAAWDVHCSGMWCSVNLTTSQHCITSQKSGDFIYTVAEALNHAVYSIQLVCLLVAPEVYTNNDETCHWRASWSATIWKAKHSKSYYKLCPLQICTSCTAGKKLICSGSEK